MATRLYLPSSGTPPLASLAVDSNWELTDSLTRLPTKASESDTTKTDIQRTWPATTTQQWCWFQYQSPPLLEGYSWTTSDTVSMVIRCLEAAAQVDSHLAYVVRVVSGDGSTVRGVIGLYHATSSEFATTAETRIHSARTDGASNFSSQAGDRIIVEIGLHGVTPTANYAIMRVGDPVAYSDFPLTAGLSSDLNPWVELSRTIQFGTLATPSSLHAYMNGIVGSTVHAFTAGSLDSNSNTDAYVSGRNANAKVPWLRVTAPRKQGTAVDTFNPAYLAGNDSQLGSIPAYSAGSSDDLSGVAAYLQGIDNAIGNIPAFLVSSDSDLSACSSFLVGSEDTNTSVSAFINSNAIEAASTPAYLSGIAFAPPELLFEANHEAGDLSEYDDGSVTVSAVNIDGSRYAISIDPDYATDLYALKTLSLNPPNVVRARFYFHPNSTRVVNTSDKIKLLVFYKGAEEIAYIEYGCTSTPTRSLTITLVDDNGVEQASTPFTIPNSSLCVEICFTRATTATSSNGRIELWIEGVSRKTVTGVDNYDKMSLINLFYFGGLDKAYDWTNFTRYYLDALAINITGQEIGRLHTKQVYLKGSINDNSAQSGYLGGSDDLRSSTTAFAQGSEDILSFAPVYISGQEQTQTQATAFLQGQSPASSSQVAFIAVDVNDKSAQPAFIEGFAANASAVIAFMVGQDNSTSSQSAYTEGITRDTVHAFLAGGENSINSQPGYLSGLDITKDNCPSYLAGQDLPSSVVPAFLQGSDNATATIPAYLFSEEQTSHSTPAFLKGLTAFSGNIVGFLAGQDNAITQLNGYLQGSISDTSSIPSFLKGQEQAIGNQAAFLAGGIVQAASVPAWLSGQDTNKSNSPAFIEGYSANASAIIAFLVGSQDTNSAVSGYTEGVIRSSLAAYMTGGEIATDNLNAYANGSASGLGSLPAYLVGYSANTSSVPCYMQGQEDINGNLRAYVYGQDQLSDHQHGYLRGSSDLLGELAGYLRGATETQEVQAAYLSGIERSTQPAFLTGQDLAQTEQAAYLSGAQGVQSQQAAYTLGLGGLVSNAPAYLVGISANQSSLPAFLSGAVESHQPAFTAGTTLNIIDRQGEFTITIDKTGSFVETKTIAGDYEIVYNRTGKFGR